MVVFDENSFKIILDLYISSYEYTADATPTNADTIATNQSTQATNQNTTATNQNTGGGAAHDNMPPYLAVYMWKRTG